MTKRAKEPPLWSVGQLVWIVPGKRPLDGYQVRIVKIGTQWITAEKLDPKWRTEIRFSKSSGFVQGAVYGATDRAWPSLERASDFARASYLAESLASQIQWRSRHDPRLTEADVRAAAKLLRVELPK